VCVRLCVCVCGICVRPVAGNRIPCIGIWLDLRLDAHHHDAD
jgi:hypothetical protein